MIFNFCDDSLQEFKALLAHNMFCGCRTVFLDLLGVFFFIKNVLSVMTYCNFCFIALSSNSGKQTFLLPSPENAIRYCVFFFLLWHVQWLIVSLRSLVITITLLSFLCCPGLTVLFLFFKLQIILQ